MEDTAGQDNLNIYQSSVTGWYLTGQMPIRDLLSLANRILVFVYIALAASAVIAIILGYIMVRLFAKPLVRLKDRLNEASMGDLTVRVPVHSQMENIELDSDFYTIASKAGFDLWSGDIVQKLAVAKNLQGEFDQWNDKWRQARQEIQP